jgi:hypothetical protein
MSAKIAFACGTAEAARILNLDRSPHLLCMSDGDADTLRRRLKAAISAGATHVMRFDVSGALSDALSPGDLACALFAIGAGMERIAFDPAWAARIIAATGAKPATFALVASTLWTAAAKAALGAETGALAVDMESGLCAEVAAECGVLCAAVGAISDAKTQNLGADAANALNADGSTNIFAVLESVVADPGELPDLMRLASTSTLAFDALAQAQADMNLDYLAR